jgi:hypothetical protein
MTSNEIKALAARTSETTSLSLDRLRNLVRTARECVKSHGYNREEAAYEMGCVAGFEDNSQCCSAVQRLMLAAM